ncbi:hypothetical protein ACFOWM_01955 [Ferruginibacter yonginensis]|uniref:tRNA modification GTPase n=1 Tax=Ferruginibacter yonginensis TaxID=1310416 RepID=A0ABV8QN35_9BACT
MKTTLLIIFVVFFSAFSSAQITFEPSYFIKNDGSRIDCLIKNKDWKNNPKEFAYKLNATDIEKNIKIDEVKLFEIANKLKYEKHVVEIDYSSEEISKLTENPLPVFETDTLFLKVLIEGKATLYYFENGNVNRYFFKVGDGEVTQLVYKSYLFSDGNIAYNKAYQTQILTDMQHPNLTEKVINKINYNSKDLINAFLIYNENKGSNYNNLAKTKSTNISVRPGIEFSNAVISNPAIFNNNIKTATNLNFRIGIEAEFLLGFNNNKWAIIVEPTYKSINSTTSFPDRKVVLKYNTIEVPIGVRYYSFLNSQSKLFFNAQFMQDFALNSTIKYNTVPLKITTKGNFVFGLGYKYLNKYGIEVRFNTTKDILKDYVVWKADYNSTCIVFSYKLF